eukprot:2824557-Lingulodinium_polyedra.AAC.1
MSSEDREQHILIVLGYGEPDDCFRAFDPPGLLNARAAASAGHPDVKHSLRAHRIPGSALPEVLA